MKSHTLILLVCLAAAPAMGQAVRAQSAQTGAEINLRKTVTVEVVRKTKDAVVNISAMKTVRQRVSPWGDFDPFWQQFGRTMKVPASSLGSGFIIHPDGYVVTNHHVIDRARQIQVELADGRKLAADLISSDAEADLAILKITDTGPRARARPFPILELGDSSDLMIGEPVIAVGNPMGFSHSVSTGIVSALHRDLTDDDQQVTLSDVVQTDAAINPGNSGGPLLNAYGQVIGINTAIRGDAQNIGFAIQVNKLRDLIPELMSPSHVNKMDVPIKLAEKRTLTPPANIDSEVVLAGEEGSVVRTINGRRPVNIVDAYAILLRTRADQKTVTLGFADGKERRYELRPAPVPATVAEARKRLGITIEQVTPMLAERHHLQTEDGLLINEVLRDSPAWKAGLKPGDVIVQLAVRRVLYRVSTLDDFGTLLANIRAGTRVRLVFIRGDQVESAIVDL